MTAMTTATSASLSSIICIVMNININKDSNDKPDCKRHRKLSRQKTRKGVIEREREREVRKEDERKPGREVGEYWHGWPIGTIAAKLTHSWQSRVAVRTLSSIVQRGTAATQHGSAFACRCRAGFQARAGGEPDHICSSEVPQMQAAEPETFETATTTKDGNRLC